MKTNALLLALLGSAAVHAQTAGIVTLRASRTTAQTSMVPVLTWSTNPVAQSCTASGGWSGTKAVSGTQTLPSINANTNYTLTCSWSAGNATVNWTAPTTNTNGSALTNLGSFKVMYGTSATSLSQTKVVADITSRSSVVQSLTPGTWYFAVRAVNTSQTESGNSNVAQKNIMAATAAATAPITITTAPPPPPPPPTTNLKTDAKVVYDVVVDAGYRRLGRVVGSIALGKPCQSNWQLGTSFYRVTNSDVTITTTPGSAELVVWCAIK